MAPPPKLSVFLVMALAALAQKPARPPEEQPAPLESEQKKIIAQITEKALKYSQELPNFVCNQITRRNIDQSGTDRAWRLIDTVNEELNYVDHKEAYTVVSVNGKKATNGNHDRPGGLTSEGEFGGLLSWIFDPKAETHFEWSSWAKINGRETYVFGYRVELAHSKFSITSSKTKQLVGFIGLVYADVETNNVTRILVIGQSPAGFPVQGVNFDLFYGFTKIGDQEFLLPLKSDLRAKDGKSIIWNEVEFRNYRKFGADSKVSFEAK